MKSSDHHRDEAMHSICGLYVKRISARTNQPEGHSEYLADELSAQVVQDESQSNAGGAISEELGTGSPQTPMVLVATPRRERLKDTNRHKKLTVNEGQRYLATNNDQLFSAIQVHELAKRTRRLRY